MSDDSRKASNGDTFSGFRKRNWQPDTDSADFVPFLEGR